MAFAARLGEALGCERGGEPRVSSSGPFRRPRVNVGPSAPSRLPKQVSSLRIMSAAFPDKTSRNTRVTDVP